MAETIITCIIPYFNENDRVAKVVISVLSCPLISEIITVDDGSTDGGYESLIKTHPNANHQRLRKNIGKAGAVFAALNNAKGTHILLLDADLSNIQETELSAAILYMQNHNEVDMLVFKMKHFLWSSKLLRHDVLLSGNAIIKRKDFLGCFQERNPKGYQLEVSVNQYMIDHNKRVVYYPFSAMGYLPLQKQGFFKIIIRDIKMYSSIIDHVGIPGYLKQTLEFAMDQAV